MASFIRPTIMRSAGFASKRVLTGSSSIAASAMMRNAFVRDVVPRASVTAFHTSTRRSILPPLPQALEGTVNDAARVPPTTPSEGSYHWSFERLLSIGLIPIIVAPFAAGSLNPVLDASLGAMIIIHSHIGFEASIIDYFPKRRVPRTRTFLTWLLRACTVGTGVALYEFETNDVGITEGIKRIWKA